MISEEYSRKRKDKYSRYMDLVSSVVLGDGKKQNLKIIDKDYLIKTLKTNRVPIRFFGKTKQKNRYLTKEKERVKHALELIKRITEEFDKRKIPFVFIKTLENLPDIGQDIDIYTEASIKELDTLFIKGFKAKLGEASFSDRIARKRNYLIGEVPIEVHCSRLGQVGEDSKLATEILRNRKTVKINGIKIYSPMIEHKLMLMAQQRVYRHLNIRICDVYNTLKIIKDIDTGKLKKISKKYGMREGVILYLSYINKIARYYAKNHIIESKIRVRDWPSEIKDRNMHFRFPEFSTALKSYSSKIISYLLKMDVPGLLRLSLVLPLGVMHVMEAVFIRKNNVW